MDPNEEHDLGTLLDGLSSPDPGVRDGWAYAELATGISTGRFAEHTDLIRTTAVANLGAEEVQARTFAPLVLAWLVAAGDRDRASFEAVTAWYVAERDTRGFDQRLGWLHAVAHGADYLGTCAEVGLAGGPEILDVLARRVVAPGSAWLDQEDARVSAAAVLSLQHCHGPEEATTWTQVLSQALDRHESDAAAGPPSQGDPAWLHNLRLTCATLYATLAEQPRNGPDEEVTLPHAERTRHDLARVLARVTPWLLSPRRS